MQAVGEKIRILLFLANFLQIGCNFEREIPSRYGIRFNTIECRINELDERNESQIKNTISVYFWLIFAKMAEIFEGDPLKVRISF